MVFRRITIVAAENFLRALERFSDLDEVKRGKRPALTEALLALAHVGAESLGLTVNGVAPEAPEPPRRPAKPAPVPIVPKA